MGAVIWVQCFSPLSRGGSGLGAVLKSTQPWGQWFGCSTIDHSAMGAVLWVQCFSPLSRGGQWFGCSALVHAAMGAVVWVQYY